jgi:predicted transcriptional regulator
MTTELVAKLATAYFSQNVVAPESIPDVMAEFAKALNGIAANGVVPVEAPVMVLVPAVSIKKSVTPDAIICLEDGKGFKSLKRHLRAVYNLSPAEYRAKWNLPASYPMVAPNYAAARSELAKKMGLGRKARPVVAS